MIKTLWKKISTGMLLLAAALACCLPLAAASVQGDENHLEQYIGLYGYRFTEAVAQGVRRDFSPQSASCGPVQVRFRELLYDGQWLYAAASVRPTVPASTLILPGDSESGDPVCGHYFAENAADKRSYQTAAAADGKQLLAVYVYIKEFDQLGEYFLDSYQTEETILFSGSRVAAGSKPVSLTWTVQLYEVDKVTGKYSFLMEWLFPMDVEPMAPYVESVYYAADREELPFDSAVLVQTALGAYVHPQWRTQQDSMRYHVTLIEADQREVARSGMPSEVYALESKPETLTFALINLDEDGDARHVTLTAQNE